MPFLRPISKKQFIIKMSALPDISWNKMSTPTMESDTYTYTDPDLGIKVSNTDFISGGEVTISKPYDPVTDGNVQATLENVRKVGGAMNISATPVLADVNGSVYPSGVPIGLFGCKVKSYSLPDIDRDGTGIAEFSVVVMPLYIDAKVGSSGSDASGTPPANNR